MLALLAGLITVNHALQAPPNMVTMQMVFLRTVPGKSIPKSEERAAHLRHMEVLEKLWLDGKAVIAGRIEDKTYAGLVLLDAKDATEAKDLLKDDPYIKTGVLVPDVLPWMFENVFHKAPRFLDLEKIWFGILERPKNAPQYPAAKLEELQSGHLANIRKMAEDGLLASAGPFLSNDSRRGIFVFFSKNLSQIKRAVSADPLIKAKRLELKLMPWWTGKGTVVQYKSK
jgi:uncharacterized protein YciI